jgi:hypothetical protein
MSYNEERPQTKTRRDPVTGDTIEEADLDPAQELKGVPVGPLSLVFRGPSINDLIDQSPLQLEESRRTSLPGFQGNQFSTFKVRI